MTYLLGDSNQIKIGGITVPIYSACTMISASLPFAGTPSSNPNFFPQLQPDGGLILYVFPRGGFSCASPLLKLSSHTCNFR